MAFIGIGFAWKRAAGGYQLAGRRIEPRDKTMVARAPLDAADPHSNKELYQRFANLRGKPDHALIAFAGDYGLLDTQEPGQSEDVRHWRRMIENLSTFLEWAGDPVLRPHAIQQLSAHPSLGNLSLKLLALPEGRAGFQVVPKTLLGAIWLQFVQHMADGREIRACASCSDWFNAAGKGPAATYCSTKCRNKVNNAKRKESRK